MENWKSIKDHPEYEVSDLGRIRKNGELVNTWVNDKGYVSFSLNGKSKQIHRFVAKAFVPNPESKPQVDHIFGDKTDNRAASLRWVTNSENMINRIRNGYKAHYKRVLEPHDIPVIRGMKARGFSNYAIADKFNIGYKYVSMICNGRRWSHIRTPFDSFEHPPAKKQNPNQLLIQF